MRQAMVEERLGQSRSVDYQGKSMKIVRNSKHVFAATIAVALMGTLAPTVASASVPQPAAAVRSVEVLDDSQRAELVSFFEENGVTAEVQQSLLQKLESGEVWLSLTEGAVPVSEAVTVEGDLEVTRSTYADGSVAVQGVSAAAGEVVTPASPGQIAPRAVRACSYSGSTYGGYWKNCVADVNLGVVRMQFNFDYENVQGSGAKITRYWNQSHHVVGGAMTNHRLVKMSNTDVRYNADFSVAFSGFPVGWTAYMGVRINGSTASTYNN